MSVKLKESTGSLVDHATESKSGKRWRVKVIEAGQGSSAFYPERVLEDYASVFTAGTHMYFNHPTLNEDEQRPERDVRDLVGKLATDATYEDGALYAEAEFYPHVAPIVESMAGDIGLSIRAYGTAQESKTGPVLTSFTGVESVDLVTKAGAGGRFIEAIESARPFKEAKSSDRGQQLSTLVGDAANSDWAWVRDYDETTRTVWYDIDGTVYQQSYEVTNDVASALVGERTEVRVATEYVPATESDTTTKENSMNEAQEAKLDALIESMTGLSATLTTLAEGAKPVPAKPEDEVEKTATDIDPLEAAKALAASELSEAGQAMALSRVSESVSLSEAIEAQKTYEESIRESAGDINVIEESAKKTAVPFKKFGA